MWQYTAGWPPLSQPRKQLMAIGLSNGFSCLRLGVFHISLRTQKTQWEGGRKENKHGLGLSPSARSEMFVTL